MNQTSWVYLNMHSYIIEMNFKFNLFCVDNLDTPLEYLGYAYSCWHVQGALNEREGSEQLTSPLRKLVL
jgi:hypothetical protein